MKYQLIWILYWLSNVMSCFAQFAPMQRRRVSDPCDGNNAALVEHFFTIIFSEIRNPPPVCVCVQMCVDQATYCYPNGCLRKAELKKEKRVVEDRPVEDSQIFVVENKKPMVLVDNSGGGQEANFDQVIDTTQPTTTEVSFKKFMNRYAIDNSRIIYKYRKLPKVQMQYNLREQVKNTKSNLLSPDVANNRWPVNKMKQVTIGKPYQGDVMTDLAMGSKYFKTIPAITPRYLKRDLKPVNHVFGKNSQFSDKAQTEESEKFSLEKLINDLIESSLDNTDNYNNSDTDVNTTIQDLNNDIQTIAVTSNDMDLVLSKEISDATNELTYDTTTLRLLNETNEILINKSFEYDEDQQSQTNKEVFKNVYSDDTIESLSKRIDQLNNTSYELLHMQNNIEPTIEVSTNAEINRLLPFNKTSDMEKKYKSTSELADDVTHKHSTP